MSDDKSREFLQDLTKKVDAAADSLQELNEMFADKSGELSPEIPKDVIKDAIAYTRVARSLFVVYLTITDEILKDLEIKCDKV